MTIEQVRSELVFEEKKDERQIWEEMDPLAWHYSVCKKGSIFRDTYEITRSQIVDAVKHDNYDIILECGSGTGDIIGNLQVSVDRIGIDINELFIEHSRIHHDHRNMRFELLDILDLESWWIENEFDKKYKKPLIVCVNNTLNIMPEEIRGKIVDQMLRVVGNEGHCMISYWNGDFFPHAVKNFYKVNPQLCGPFFEENVNWQDRILECPSGYSTHWMTPVEVQTLLRSYKVDISVFQSFDKSQVEDHINCGGLAIFAWFSKSCKIMNRNF